MHCAGLECAALGLPYGSGVALLADGTLEVGTRDGPTQSGAVVPLLLLPVSGPAAVVEQQQVGEAAHGTWVLKEVHLPLGTRWKLQGCSAPSLVSSRVS